MFALQVEPAGESVGGVQQVAGIQCKRALAAGGVGGLGGGRGGEEAGHCGGCAHAGRPRRRRVLSYLAEMYMTLYG